MPRHTGLALSLTLALALALALALGPGAVRGDGGYPWGTAANEAIPHVQVFDWPLSPEDSVPLLSSTHPTQSNPRTHWSPEAVARVAGQPHVDHPVCAPWDSPLSPQDVLDSLPALIVALEKPIVIRGHPLMDQWPALKTWNPQVLASKLPLLPHVYDRDDSPVFRYRNGDKPLTGAAHWKYSMETTKKSLLFPAKALADQLDTADAAIAGDAAASAASAAYPYRFFTGPLQLRGDDFFAGGGIDSATVLYRKELMDDIVPYLDLAACVPLYPGFCGGHREISANLWMGSPNVTSHAHYDGANNMYAQIYGQKTFYLAPPAAHMPLFPRLHESYRSVLSENITADMFTARATLVKGDLLLLPPHWFHHVVADTPTISVNFWCDSWQLQVAWLQRMLPFPFEVEWIAQVNSRVALTQLYAGLMAHMYTGAPEPALALLASLYPDRYDGLLAPDLLVNPPVSALCANLSLPTVLHHPSTSVLAGSLYMYPTDPTAAANLEAAFADLVAAALGPVAVPIPHGLSWRKWHFRLTQAAAMMRHIQHGPASALDLAHIIFIADGDRDYTLVPEILDALDGRGDAAAALGSPSPDLVAVANREILHTVEELAYALLVPDASPVSLAHTLPVFFRDCLAPAPAAHPSPPSSP